MLRTHIFPCRLPKILADELNCESGRIYTQTLIWHYRIYRRTGHWLSCYAAQRLGDSLSGTFLSAFSRDAAQEAFYRASKTARINRGIGVRYPHHFKEFRTTVWKNPGIRLCGKELFLARARGVGALRVRLPSDLLGISLKSIREIRLVYNQSGGRYQWHIVIEDDRVPLVICGGEPAAIDMGEIHPVVVASETECVVFTARQLRSLHQYTSKRLSEIRSRQDRLSGKSRRWKKLQRRKQRFLAKQRNRSRDIEHKVSRAVVDWAVRENISTLAIGDVRDVADGKRLNRKSQQKIGNWSHGKVRRYVEYKACAVGIKTKLVNECYSSQTCPQCGQRHKPRGRIYHCAVCGFVGHRDAVGAINILSRLKMGEVGKVSMPKVKYRMPADFRRGLRSRSDTTQVALVSGGA